MEFPVNFKKCPICGCPDTVTRLAIEELKDKGQIPKDAFASAEKVPVPLLQPELVAAVPFLIFNYDVCAKCGTRYCTRVDKTTSIVQPMKRGPSQPPPFPFGKG